MLIPGPFSHIPDGNLSESDLRIGLDVLDAFEQKITPVIGQLTTLVGHPEMERIALAGVLTRQMEKDAADSWHEAFVCPLNWSDDDFAGEALNIIIHTTREPSFHFGDASLKELMIAHAADLIVQTLRIQILGGRRDSLHLRHAGGYIKAETERRARRDRAILGGAKPYSGTDQPKPTPSSIEP